jgi:hypothetical protein
MSTHFVKFPGLRWNVGRWEEQTIKEIFRSCPIAEFRDDLAVPILMGPPDGQ